MAKQQVPVYVRSELEPTARQFEVVSPRFAEGKVGEIITLTLTDNQELSLLQSGAVKRAEPRPVEAEPSQEGGR